MEKNFFFEIEILLQNNFSAYKVYGGSHVINVLRLLTEGSVRNHIRSRRFTP